MMRGPKACLLAIIALLTACGENTSEQPSDIDRSATETSTLAPETPAKEPAGQLAAVSSGGVRFVFADPAKGAALLIAEDDYTSSVQPREASIRAGDPRVTSFSGLKPLYLNDVLPWNAEERAALTKTITDLLPQIDKLDRLLPTQVLLVKAGQVVEGGLPHTRGHAIIFTGDSLPLGDELKALFLHELHHVLTRANPGLRDDYYALIGFRRCELQEPDALRRARLSNPDAPRNQHFIDAAPQTMAADGVIPFLHTARDFTGEGKLGDYFAFGLLPVDFEGGRCVPLAQAPSELLPVSDVPTFLERVASNTGYIIHPEEIMADNFVHWAMQREDLADPAIPLAIGRFWAEH